MIRVKDWSSYQSYKDRKPPWIRFHKSMLDNYEFHLMCVSSRALLPMFWLIASEDENPVSGLIRDGYEKIAFRLRVTVQEVTDAVNECEKSGFLEVLESDNNKQLQACTESVRKGLRVRSSGVTPETEAKTEKEAEKEAEAKTEACPFNIDLFLSDKNRVDFKAEAPGLDFNGYIIPAFNNFIKKKGKPSNPIGSFRAFVRKCYKDYVIEHGQP